MNTLVSTVMMSTLIVGPFYLSHAIGLNSGEVGLVMSIGPSLSILSGFPAGKLVDRFGVRKISSLGLGSMLIGTVGVIILPPHFGLYGYAIAIAFLSPGYQLFLAANSTGVMTSVEKNQKGVISGLLNLSRNLGLVTGASGMGAVCQSQPFLHHRRLLCTIGRSHQPRFIAIPDWQRIPDWPDHCSNPVAGLPLPWHLL
jgi:MFS family permease